MGREIGEMKKEMRMKEGEWRKESEEMRRRLEKLKREMKEREESKGEGRMEGLEGRIERLENKGKKDGEGRKGEGWWKGRRIGKGYGEKGKRKKEEKHNCERVKRRGGREREDE